MRTLILTGATGFIGRRLAAGLGAQWRVVPAYRAMGFELERPESARLLFEAESPAAVIHAAAVAGPDDCERDPGLGRRVNLDGARLVAELSARAGARLIHFSTDLVFDGAGSNHKESDEARPISVYGRLKLAAERAVLEACPGAAVLRVSSVYGRPLGGRLNWVDEQRVALSSGRPVRAFTDQWRSSTDGDKLPELCRRLLREPALTGVFHWGGAERLSRLEAARVLCRIFGFDPALLEPASAATVSFVAPRPRDCSLDSSKLAAAIGLSPSRLEDDFTTLRDAVPRERLR